MLTTPSEKNLKKNYCEYFLFFFALKFMTESKNGLSTIRRFEPKGNYVFSPFILSGVFFSSKRARTKIFPFFSHYFFSPTGFFVSRNFHLFIELTTDLVKKILSKYLTSKLTFKSYPNLNIM